MDMDQDNELLRESWIPVIFRDFIRRMGKNPNEMDSKEIESYYQTTLSSECMAMAYRTWLAWKKYKRIVGVTDIGEELSEKVPQVFLDYLNDFNISFNNKHYMYKSNIQRIFTDVMVNEDSRKGFENWFMQKKEKNIKS